jgi:hypothetical protein
MTVIEHPERPTRHGRGFPVDEAARLLAAGVYLPDYPAELVAEAWRINYVGAVEDLREAAALLADASFVHYQPPVRGDKARRARALSDKWGQS